MNEPSWGPVKNFGLYFATGKCIPYVGTFNSYFLDEVYKCLFLIHNF